MKKGTTVLCALSFAIAFSSIGLQVHAGLLLGKEDRESKEYAHIQRAHSDEWLMTYYVGYHNEYLKPEDIDYSLMTHIVVGGVGVNADGSLNEHWHREDGEGNAMALEVGRHAEKAGVKKLIWLGGPNEEDFFYGATADAHREKFVDATLTLVDELDYDGVDIDWEPVRPQDEARLLAFVKALREKAPDLIITVPVNWVPSSILFTKDLSVYDELARYVDKFFIMSYSMAGPWSGWNSWHGSALGGISNKTPSSVRSSVYAYTRAGVPKSQLGFGVGTYATCWEHPVQRPDRVLPATFYSKDMHVMSMRTLMEDYHVSSKEKWDRTAKVPYLTFREPKGDFGCGFISYENKRSIEEKVSYMQRSGLGGVLVWNIGTGYFPENSTYERHPYLEWAWEAMR